METVEMADLMNVVEVRIQPPHERRVIAEAKSPDEAEAIIKMAVARRGVEDHFFVAEPA
jgi:hypothetical protein